MPDDLPQKQDKRLAFLADRMAIVLVDIVERDMDYSDICFNDFYQGERADAIRRTKTYQVVLDLVRTMVREYDKRQVALDRSAGVSDESGGAQAGDGVSIPSDS